MKLCGAAPLIACLKASACLVALLYAPSGLAQVLQIPASQIEGIVGERAQPYSFFAMQEGRFEPVPHQWMAFTSEGYPAFTSDRESDVQDDAGIIEAHDRLLLRREDGGAALQGPPGERVVGELVVQYPDETLYFYVVKNAYRQATQRYVKFDTDRMIIKSTDYSLSMAPDNMLVWKDFHYRGYESPASGRQSILDTMKIRMSAGLFTEKNRLVMNNNNLNPRIEQIIEGPLAWAIHATTRLKVAGVPVLAINNYFLVMPQQTDIHSRFTMPAIASTVIQSPSMSISLDGNNLLGGQLVTSWTGENVALVDGRISEDETSMIGQKLGNENWIWFGSGRGFDVLAQLVFREGDAVPAHLLYEDSLEGENEPERFPGQLPNVGFTMQELPIGEEFYFLARLYYSRDSNGLPPGQYADKVLTPPSIRYRAGD
jgi:hypothetical protein